MVTRSLEDIEQDYRQLIAQIRQNVPGAQILVLNTMSSSAYEDIQNYAAFDAPLGATLSSVHAKDLNLMLYALERECGIAVVDVDAIAAEFGEREHLHVGVHQSGEVQAEIRAEILRILDARGVSGFTRRREALGALAAGA